MVAMHPSKPVATVISYHRQSVQVRDLQSGAVRLTLPHPRAHQRRFVLAPLEEIAPEYIFPGQRETVRELLGRLGDEQEVVREG